MIIIFLLLPPPLFNFLIPSPSRASLSWRINEKCSSTFISLKFMIHVGRRRPAALSLKASSYAWMDVNLTVKVAMRYRIQVKAKEADGGGGGREWEGTRKPSINVELILNAAIQQLIRPTIDLQGVLLPHIVLDEGSNFSFNCCDLSLWGSERAAVWRLVYQLPRRAWLITGNDWLSLVWGWLNGWMDTSHTGLHLLLPFNVVEGVECFLPRFLPSRSFFWFRGFDFCAFNLSLSLINELKMVTNKKRGTWSIL